MKNLFCDKHGFLLHITINNMFLCEKCLEEINEDEKYIKMKMEKEKNKTLDNLRK